MGHSAIRELEWIVDDTGFNRIFHDVQKRCNPLSERTDYFTLESVVPNVTGIAEYPVERCGEDAQYPLHDTG